MHQFKGYTEKATTEDRVVGECFRLMDELDHFTRAMAGVPGYLKPRDMETIHRTISGFGLLMQNLANFISDEELKDPELERLLAEEEEIERRAKDEEFGVMYQGMARDGKVMEATEMALSHTADDDAVREFVHWFMMRHDHGDPQTAEVGWRRFSEYRQRTAPRVVSSTTGRKIKDNPQA